MPRSRGGARPAARPSGFGLGSSKGQQSRSTSNMAYSAPRTAPPPPAAPSANAKPGAPSAPATPAVGASGPGLLGQMASTAAGVAIGSSIGNAIGGIFGGSGSEAANAEPMAPAAPAQQGGWNNTNNGQANNCGESAKMFTDCMSASNGDMKPCGWYFEQLKACQSASAPY
jgi:hypothetical protein